MKLKIALDIDDVILDLVSNWTVMYKRRAGIPQEQNVPITQWSVPACFRELDGYKVLNMLHSPGMFYYANPIEGAISGVKSLLDEKNFDVYFLTSAAHRTEYGEKIQWIADYFGKEASKKIIALPTGELKNFVGELFHIMVDDCPANMTGICQRKSSPHCILFDKQYNRDAIQGIDYHERVYSWTELLEKINLVYKLGPVK